MLCLVCAPTRRCDAEVAELHCCDVTNIDERQRRGVAPASVRWRCTFSNVPEVHHRWAEESPFPSSNEMVLANHPKHPLTMRPLRTRSGRFPSAFTASNSMLLHPFANEAPLTRWFM